MDVGAAVNDVIEMGVEGSGAVVAEGAVLTAAMGTDRVACVIAAATGRASIVGAGDA